MTKPEITPDSQTEARAKGLVVIFTGDGKGKTSAALGTVLRALGHGRRVYLVYFMKGKYPYGEQKILSQLPNVHFDTFGHAGFVDPTKVTEEEKEQARKAFQAAHKAMLSGDYDLIVLDEINIAIAWKLLEIERAIQLIQEKPDGLDLVLTGRHADSRLIQLADIATEMVEIRHPFTRGIPARKGIDY